MQNVLGHVYLVDDHPDIRFYLGELLRQIGYTVEVFENAEGFLARSQQMTPAVILLDMRMTGLSGLDVQRQLKEQGRHTPIIFISGASQNQEVVDALKGGAIDFLCKPFKTDDLVNAIDKGLALDVSLHEHAAKLANLQRRFQTLTAREQEVFFLILEGHPNRNISQITGVQAGTVKKHRAAVFEKMAVEDTAELISVCKGVDPGSLAAG
jgi:FixJ family two-component response regulator